MAFDYKKEYREFYLPPKKPQMITIPPMNFAAVQGRGDPNEPIQKKNNSGQIHKRCRFWL